MGDSIINDGVLLERGQKEFIAKKQTAKVGHEVHGLELLVVVWYPSFSGTAVGMVLAAIECAICKDTRGD